MRRGNGKGVLTAVLALLFLWSACTAGDLPAAKIKIGEKMADFTLRDTAGKERSLHEFKAKNTVAVIFIATKCPYSNAFNHVMADLARQYASRGVAFVGINANQTEPAGEVADHARAQPGFPSAQR